MTLPTRLSSLVSAHGPVCHGFVTGCACERCLDREHRSQVYTHEGTRNASALAKRDSDDYFKTPWRFDSGSPPRRWAAAA